MKSEHTLPDIDDIHGIIVKRVNESTNIPDDRKDDFIMTLYRVVIYGMLTHQIPDIDDFIDFYVNEEYEFMLYDEEVNDA